MTDLSHQRNRPYRRLRRSRSDRMLGGVCAGVANYLRVDPTLVRVGVAVLAIITWGVALLAYGVAWVVMPEEEEAGPVSPVSPAP